MPPANLVINGGDSPSISIRRKKSTQPGNWFEMSAQVKAGIVSSGNTGAIAAEE